MYLTYQKICLKGKNMKWLVIILTAMFTGARLAGAINWGWLLVFSPAIPISNYQTSS